MKIVITESQFTNIKEMVVSSLPSQKLLKWFLDRVNHTFVFFDTETNGLWRRDLKSNHPEQPHLVSLAAQLCDNKEKVVSQISFRRNNITNRTSDETHNRNRRRRANNCGIQ